MSNSVKPGQTPPWVLKTAQEILANEKDLVKVKGKLAALSKQSAVPVDRILDATHVAALRADDHSTSAIADFLKKYGGEEP